jgi:hypothetical protein
VAVGRVLARVLSDRARFSMAAGFSRQKISAEHGSTTQRPAE